MGQIQSFEEFFDMVLRRRWIILAVTVIGTLAALAVALSRPAVYESVAVIQVELPDVAPATPGMAVPDTSAALLLQAIQQQLTTRDALVAVIQRHSVYSDLGLTMDQKVALLRQSVRFETVASVANQGFGTPAIVSAMLVVVQMGTAELAARVANDMAQSVLDEGTNRQMQTARDTYAFFQEEEARLWTEMADLETEVAAYTNRNAGAMPAMRDAQQGELMSLDTELRAVEQELLAITAQRAALQRSGANRATDRRTLEDLNARAAVLETQRDGLSTRRAALDSALRTMPQVERDMAAFDRRRSQMQDRYQVVTQRLAEAETNLRLAERQQAQRLTMLERAVTPEFPLSSARRKILAAGVMGSLLLGLGLAFVLDLLFPVVRTADQMERQLDLRPVVSIPDLRQRERPRHGMGAALAGVPGLVLGLPWLVQAGLGGLVLAVLALILV